MLPVICTSPRGWPYSFNFLQVLPREMIYCLIYWNICLVCVVAISPLRMYFIDDEKFELSCINPGLVFGPVLHGSYCTSMEVNRNTYYIQFPWYHNIGIRNINTDRNAEMEKKFNRWMRYFRAGRDITEEYLDAKVTGTFEKRKPQTLDVDITQNDSPNERESGFSHPANFFCEIWNAGLWNPKSH